MKKRFFSLLLTLSLLLAMLPTAASAAAADTGRAIQFVTSGNAPNLPGAQASSIFFGTY